MARDMQVKITLGLDSKQYSAALTHAGQQVQQFSGQVQGGMAGASMGAERLADAIAKVGHYGAGLLALGQVSSVAQSFVHTADAVTSLHNSLKLATGSAQSAGQAYTALFDIAQRSRVSFTELGATYASVSRAGQELGVSQQRMLAVTEAIGNAMTISGGSAQSMQAALVQLGQGMSSGVLRGEELNSVMEQAPRLAKALADGLDVPLGQLRDMGAAGQITAAQVVSALESQAAVLRGEVAGATLTAGQAWTQLSNAATKAVGDLDGATGASRALAGAVSGLAGHLDVAFVAGGALAGLAAGKLAQGMAASVAGALADRAARVASLQTTVAQTEAVAIYTGMVLRDAQATLAHTTGLGASVVAQNAVMAARAKDTAAMAAQTAAQAALTAATSKASLALGLLGGPIGLVTTVLGLGAAAWAMWGNSAAQAEQQASGAVAKSTPDIIANINQQIERLQRRNALAGEKLVVSGALDLVSEEADKLGEIDLKIAQLRATPTANQTEYVRQLTDINKLLAERGTLVQAINARDALAAPERQRKAQEALASAMEQYASKAEKADKTIEKLRATHGALFTPELEARVRRHIEGADKTTAAAARQNTAYKSLTDSIADKLQAGALELALGGKLTESQQLGLKLDALQADAKTRVGAAAERAARAQIAQLAAQEQEAQARAAAAQAIEAERSARQALRQEMERSADGLIASNQQLQGEIELIGLSAAQQQDVLRQRAEALILTKEATLAELERASAISGTMSREQIALAAEIAALKERNALLGAKGAKEAAAETAQKSADEWQKTTDQVNQSLTDALVRGFESGKDAAANLRDTVVNMFKTMGLRPVVSAIVAPVAGGITGMLGLPGAANAAQGGGGASGAANAASSAYNLINSGFNVASQAGTWLSGKGTELALQYMGESAGTLLNNFALGMSSTSSMSAAATALQGTGAEIAGLAVGSLMNGFAGYGISKLLSGGYSAGGWVNTVAGIASAIPSVGPIAGVVGGIVNRAFGRKHEQTNLQGTFGGTSGFEGQMEDYYKGGWLRSGKSVYSPVDEETRSGLAGQFNTLRFATAAMADVLGLGVDAISSFTADVNIKLKGLSAEDAQKKIQEEFDKIAESLASVAMGTDAYANAGETAVQTLTRLASSLTTVNSTFKTLGIDLQFEKSTAGADSASDYMSSFGGAEAFSALTASYYNNYYTEAEKTANVTRQITKTLAEFGIELPPTREAFRELTASHLAMGVTGADSARALLSVSEAFASITPAAEAVAETVPQALERLRTGAVRTADDIARSLLDLEREGASLRADLLQAQGDTAGAATARYAITTAVMTDAERAAYDYNQTLREQITAAQAAAQAQATAASLWADLADAQGDTALAAQRRYWIETQGMTQAELAAYDYNATIRQQIAAANEASAAIERVTSTLGNLSATRFDLQNQLLTQAGQGALVQQRTDARDLEELTAGLPADMAAQIAAEFAANLALRDQVAANEQAIDSWRESLALVERDMRAAQAAQEEAARAVRDAQIDAAQADVDAARQSLTAANERARSAQQSITTLQGIFDMLGSSIGDLRGQVASTAQMQADEARAYIAQASVLVRSGAVPDQGKLQAAIRAATTGIDGQQWARQADADYQRLVFAGELAALQDGTAGQLTIAEQHLSFAQQGVDIAQQQLDALDAIAKSLGARASSAAAKPAEPVTSATAQAAGAGVAKDQWSTVNGTIVYASSGGALGVHTGSDIDIYGKDGSKFLGSEAIAYVRNQLAVNDAASVYAAAVGKGISAVALDQLMGWPEGTSNDWASQNQLPQFAVGTNYVTGDMDARIHKGEAILPAPFNPWAGGKGLVDMSRMERLVETLIQRVQALETLLDESNNYTSKSAEVLTRATNDGMGFVQIVSPL